MSTPTKYERGYSFSGYQATNPNRPLPGPVLDNELDGIETSILEVVNGLNDIRRADGALKNGIVTKDALAPGLSTGVDPATLWAAGNSYTAENVVFFDAAFYRCVQSHVSNADFTVDLAAGYWVLFADFSDYFEDVETWKNEAEAAKDDAETAAGTATTAASTATSAASTASTAATTASTAATTASTAATNAANSYDAFDDRYLGVKATLPSVDNDGNSLVEGALVSLSGSVSPVDGMYVRRSGAWEIIGSNIVADGGITSVKINSSAFAAATDLETSADVTDKIMSPWVTRLRMRRFMIDPLDWKSDYSAAFDGTGTGAGDRQAIQAAVDYAAGVGGGEVRAPTIAKIDSAAGNFIDLKGKVALRGMGRGASRIFGTTTGTLVRIGGSTSVDHFRGAVSDLQMDTAERGVDIGIRTAGWDIEDIYFAGIKYPVRIKGKYDGATVGDTYDAINFHLSRLEMEGLPASGVGIDLVHCGEVYVDHCKTPSPSGSTTIAMLVETAVTSVQTRGNNWTGCAWGLIHRNTYGFPTGNPRSLPGEPRENWFSWDRFDSGGIGAQIEAGYDVRFDNAWACGNTAGEGFLIGGGSLVRRLSFINPIVKGNGTYGIRTVDNLSNLDMTIHGGEIVSNGNAASNTYDNIYIGANNTRFSINTKSYSTSATGLNNITRNALNISSGCDYFEIFGDYQVCLTGAISDSSTTKNKRVPSRANSVAARTLVDTVFGATAAVATTTTALPFDDTIPQITEGGEFLTAAITPKDAANILRIEVTVNYAHSTTTWVTWALFRDSTADALCAAPQYVGNSGAPYTTTFVWEVAAGSTSATTFRVRGGGSTGSTLTFNGVGGGRQMGGRMASSIRITEFTP